MQSRHQLEKITALILFASWFTGLTTNCQTPSRTTVVHQTYQPLVIDGDDLEGTWGTAESINSFINKWPVDTGMAKLQTEVKLLYDNRNLYVFVKAINSPKKLVVQSLKRDVNPYYSDGVSIVLDPSGGAITGYTFGVNSAGAQFEGIVNNNDVSFDWDVKWLSAVRRNADFWTAEMSIPLKSMRFDPGRSSWRVNFIRNDMTNNCFSTWNRVPVQFHGANLGCLGEMTFSGTAVQKPGKIPVLIPYINTTINHANGKSDRSFKTGIDLKLPVAASMNLDVTVNPDFTQVDVDQQVINLDRYDILFPEKRIFFLENSDLFNSLGTPTVKPFISRSIGLDNTGKSVPLAGGVRLTGFANPRLRFGIMDMQSGRVDSNLRQNYFVAAIEQRIFKRSDVKAYFVNTESIFAERERISKYPSYNRVAGAEFNYLKQDGSAAFTIKMAHSFNPGQPGESSFYSTGLSVRNSKRLLSFNVGSIGKDFVTSLGYTPRLYNYDVVNDSLVRLGYYQVDGNVQFDFYPDNKSRINMTQLLFSPAVYWFSDGKFSEAALNAAYVVLTSDRRTYKIAYTHNVISLPFSTVIFSSLDNLEARKYSYGILEGGYESNFLRPFSWKLNLQGGGYYNGKRLSATGGVRQRIQPWLNLGTDITWNYIKLNSKSLTPIIVNPSVEIAFNNKLFFTTFMQYNSLIDNFNMNVRFNWRFLPMSDLYLVFNSNYLTPAYQNIGSTIALKATYWIN